MMTTKYDVGGMYAGTVSCLFKFVGNRLDVEQDISTDFCLERTQKEWTLLHAGKLLAVCGDGDAERWTEQERGEDKDWRRKLTCLEGAVRLQVESAQILPWVGPPADYESPDEQPKALVLAAVRLYLLPTLFQDSSAAEQDAARRRGRPPLIWRALRRREDQVQVLMELAGQSHQPANEGLPAGGAAASAATRRVGRPKADEEEGDAGDIDDDDDDDDDDSRLTDPVRTLRDRVFDIIAPTGWTAQHPEPPGLVSTLMPYQKRCLAWLLHREKGPADESKAAEQAGCSAAAAEQEPLHPCYRAIQLPSGLWLYVNSLTGDISLDPIPPEPDSFPGGILSDEMGLGKTVEVIALMLANRPPQGKPALVASPNDDGTLAKTPAGTLVVAPSAIVKQWVHEGLYWNKQDAEEKKKRSRRLEWEERMEQAQRGWEEQQKALNRTTAPADVEEYDARVEARKLIEQLSQADVVITTFPVLQREHHYPPLAERMRVLRHQKRYIVPESPLISMGWHRLVIDEAQRVRLAASHVALMAKRLQVKHRWCVTGTPMGPGGLEDIHGMLKVLQHDLLLNDDVWDHVTGVVHGEGGFLYGDPEAERRLRIALKPIMWRNSKSMVGDELFLPPRTLMEDLINFTPHEREFYNSVLLDVRATREQALGLHRGNSKSLEMTREGLLQLRLCCLHPQLTSKWKRAVREGQLAGGVALSMAEIMTTMAGKAAGDVQAAERELCMKMNALATALLQQAEPQPAAPAAEEAAGASTGPRRKRKRGGEDNGGTVEGSSTSKSPKKKQRGSDLPKPAHVLRVEARKILQECRAVAEGGIGALFGQAADNLPMAVASWNAWRPLQISISHALARMYDDFGLVEQAAALRADAAVKAAEVLAAPKDALEQARQRLAAVKAKISPLVNSMTASWDEVARAASCMDASAALTRWAGIALSAAGLPEGGAREWAEEMVVQLLTAQNSDKESRIQHVTALGEQEVLMGTAVKSLLRKAEAPLLELRVAVEAGYLLPAVQRAACRGLDTGRDSPLANLDCSSTESVLLGGALDDSLAAYAMQLASEALEKGSVNVEAQRKAVRKLQNQFIKQLSSLEPHASKMQDLSALTIHGDCAEVQLAAWEGVKQQLTYLRLLGDRATAELRVEKAEGDLAIQQDALDAAAQRLVTDAGDAKLTTKQLQSAVDKLKTRCNELHHHALYLESRQHEAGGEARPDEDDVQAVSRQSDLPNEAAISTASGTGIQAATSLASLLGAWDSKMAWNAPMHGDLASPAKEAEGGAALDQSARGHEHGARHTADMGEQPGEGAGLASDAAAASLPECPVCLLPITGTLQIWPCAHITCEACRNQLFAAAAAQTVPCPVCRLKSSKGQIFRSSPALTVAAAANTDDAVYRDVQVVGSWMTKVEALVRRLIYLRQTQPVAKSLVFSQWPDGLRLVSKALSVQQPPLETVMLEAGVRSWRSTNVDRFNRDLGPSIFLLPLNSGASGLTLTRANHVFLLEPSVDPALLQQAIARVHRYGQSRDVFIHQLLVNGTIEEEVHRVCKSKQALLGASPATQSAPAHENVQPQDVHVLVTAVLGDLGD